MRIQSVDDMHRPVAQDSPSNNGGRLLLGVPSYARFWPVSDRRAWRSLTDSARLHFCLLCDLQRIVDLDAEIPHGAFELRVPKQELNRSEVSGPPVDQRRFGAPH
jgi:hypothetical protein